MAHVVLVTGGAGYIGSHVVHALADAGHTPVVLDDLSTGRRELVGDAAFHEGDVADPAAVDRVFAEHAIDTVVHCAARMLVGESMTDPLTYHEVNVAGSIALLRSLQRHGCDRFIFSSSGSVYASPPDVVVDETSPRDPTSPYARTKAMVEDVLADLATAGQVRAISLRYFNPIGADPSMRTGQQRTDIPLIVERLLRADLDGTTFTINGTDWPTRDGTPIRDYVHVWDVARAHVAAVERFNPLTGERPFVTIDLGGGTGTTVRELIDAYREATGRSLTVAEGPRRQGDAAGAHTTGQLARGLLDWEPSHSIADGIQHAIEWRERHSTGGGTA